ncbi:Hypothetical protein DEACI_0440 [Acididesulfobacillus acetoxydans]|uniref:Transposase DDE domain-containing protein n=1 Tax=Acididesulfobacillus acetoxydans TaxID=1561005 RepID=A0ABM9R952_9FIRM|nr:Hypothetical protein DEACI_0440 [Acididesulfobacillus acetoxydans]
MRLDPKVSIPHRQAIGDTRGWVRYTGVRMFQFLIGRLSAVFGYTPFKCSHLFQFLIGRLSAAGTKAGCDLSHGFNSS